MRSMRHTRTRLFGRRPATDHPCDQTSCVWSIKRYQPPATNEKQRSTPVIGCDRIPDMNPIKCPDHNLDGWNKHIRCSKMVEALRDLLFWHTSGLLLWQTPAKLSKPCDVACTMRDMLWTRAHIHGDLHWLRRCHA